MIFEQIIVLYDVDCSIINEIYFVSNSIINIFSHVGL